MTARSSQLIVTPGDPGGIGPEIVWKAVRSGQFQRRGVRILCVGARAPFEKLGATVIEIQNIQSWLALSGKSNRRTVYLLSAPTQLPAALRARGRAVTPGALAGFQSGWSIGRAVRLVETLKTMGQAAALVTGPISKSHLNQGGFPFPGHTELLAHLCRKTIGTGKVRMMLANDQLRITLVTTHLPLSRVSRAITGRGIEATLDQTVLHLRNWWGISRPRVAVAALNPHAGEGGLFGREEIHTISPAIARYQKRVGKTCDVYGPLPADTLFANNHLAAAQDRFDAVICMYHDQGLIPVKLLDFRQTVNITLGLPIVRTSVDHGVAFDIAGKDLADPSSLLAAMGLAVEILKKRTVT